MKNASEHVDRESFCCGTYQSDKFGVSKRFNHMITAPRENPERSSTKPAQQNQAFFEKGGSTKPHSAVTGNEYHDSRYELALQRQVLLIRPPMFP